MHRTSDIRSLQAFVTVAKEGNVSRAAKLLHLTQPAVSLQLKRLSEDTGLTLFSRTAKGIELTRDGSLLLVKAERVLMSLSEFSQAAQRLTGEVHGKLRIGTIVDPNFIRLGQLLAGLLNTYPDIQTELMHGISGEVLNRIRREQIDVGFYLSDVQTANQQASEQEPNTLTDIKLLKLTEFNYRIVAPPGWEALVEHATWPELAALPWIGTPPNSVHSRLLAGIFKEHRCEQNIVALVDQEPSMIAMANSGVGLCLCRESIALHQRQAAGLSMAEHILVPAALSLTALKNQKKRSLIDAFFRVVEDIW